MLSVNFTVTFTIQVSIFCLDSRKYPKMYRKIVVGTEIDTREKECENCTSEWIGFWYVCKASHLEPLKLNHKSLIYLITLSAPSMGWE